MKHRSQVTIALAIAFIVGPALHARGFERCELKVDVKSTNSGILYLKGKTLYEKPITVQVVEVKTLEGGLIGCVGKFSDMELRFDVITPAREDNPLVAGLASLKAGSKATFEFEVAMEELTVGDRPQTILRSDMWLKSVD